ncbi:flagellar hook-basal body protein [Natribacillus halophilus]|uniref:Flagellar basal-body rod protein FlgG n=1 Tax=Natribacillus halophilus TaxID=549003 RepID=A0A1G8KSP3_9BACI|nr:flagellar hook-basal body protein [Natribacillus halophilus]SDI46416.1 flagellar basal-body rod protein FlgG [Natribacillus halophilus]
MLSSAVTMGQLQQSMDTISNNMANVNRNGYQRREDLFSDFLFQQADHQRVPQPEGNRLTPEGIRVGNGAGVSQTAMRHDQGAMHETERALDFALTEPGSYFPVQTTVDGTAQQAFTRDGAFYLSESAPGADTWHLVTQEGDVLTDGAGEPLVVPGQASDFTLQPDGTLVAVMADGEELEVGDIEVANITRPQLLEAMGNNLLQLPDLDGLDVDEAGVLSFAVGGEEQVMQGALEQSNVDMAAEMTKLLEMQRSYSMHARNITQNDEMMSLVNSLR